MKTGESSEDGDNPVLAKTGLPARSQYFDVPRSEAFEELGSSLLLEYWDRIRRRKGIVLLSASIGLLLAVAVTFFQTPIYKARTSIEIQSFNENFLNLRNVNPTANETGSYRAEYDLQTQAEILQSQYLLGRVISKLNLAQRLGKERDQSRLSVWRRALGWPGSVRILAPESTIATVVDNLKIHPQTNTRIIEIFYDSTDAQLAADVDNALAAEFIQQNIEFRGQATQQTGDWLTRQMEDIRVKLEKSDEELQGYARVSGLLFTQEKDNVADEELRQLQSELSKAQADRIARQSKYELALAAPLESLPEVLEDTVLKDYQLKLTDLRRQLAELSSSLTAAHPSVKKVQAQIVVLESALEKERANVVQRIRNEFQSDQNRENLLAANYTTHARLMSEEGEKVTHYNLLKREVDTNRQIYDSMLQSVKEAAIASALRASNVRVLDLANPPSRPYKPSLARNVALGLLAGMGVGIILIFVRERADHSIHAPGESSFYLAIPELGVIPAAAAEERDQFSRSKKRAGVQNGHGPEFKKKKFVELATSLRKKSALADSFRATLTSIIYGDQDHESPRVIVLTSPNPGEGKTTVASNLALAPAEIGQRVLLIDGDMRQPRLHELFEVPNLHGLSDILEGKKSASGGELTAVQTGYRGLFLLPSGPVPSNLSAILHSSRTIEFLDNIKREFDMIIIDTPPIAQIPDARVLARIADCVILVLTFAKTDRETAAAVCQRLKEDGSRVLGTVLNKWDPRKANRYGPGYGYAYRNCCDNNAEAL